MQKEIVDNRPGQQRDFASQKGGKLQNNVILFSHKDIGDIDRGGVCVLFKSLAAGLANKGWKVHVTTTQQLSIDRVNTHILPFVEDPQLYSRQVTEVIYTVSPAIAEASTWRYELLDYSQRQRRDSMVVVRADPSAGTLFSKAQHLDKGEKYFVIVQIWC